MNVIPYFHTTISIHIFFYQIEWLKFFEQKGGWWYDFSFWLTTLTHSFMEIISSVRYWEDSSYVLRVNCTSDDVQYFGGFIWNWIMEKKIVRNRFRYSCDDFYLYWCTWVISPFYHQSQFIIYFTDQKTRHDSNLGNKFSTSCI